MKPQIEMAWGQLEFRNNEREPKNRFTPVCTPSYVKWIVEQYTLKPAYDNEKALINLRGSNEETEQWRSKAKVPEIKLRRTKAVQKQSREDIDKVKRSNGQLMNEFRELHDDTRRMLNRYSVKLVANKGGNHRNPNTSATNSDPRSKLGPTPRTISFELDMNQPITTTKE
ncbi:hypothetical protein ACH5RR_029668 [Cinchona calisaya]|uniref:Uncharacterized protein n=1 Tax=Cinchona calisaya TaxID=153742 RepID=A0ABD2YSD1_9GENT